MAYSLESRIGDLMKNPVIKEKFAEIAPKAANHPYLNSAIEMGFSLKQCAAMAPGELPPDKLAEMEEFLKTVE